MNQNQRIALLRIGKQKSATIHSQTARSLIEQGYAEQITEPFRSRYGIKVRLTAKGQQFVAA